MFCWRIIVAGGPRWRSSLLSQRAPQSTRILFRQAHLLDQPQQQSSSYTNSTPTPYSSCRSSKSLCFKGTNFILPQSPAGATAFAYKPYRAYVSYVSYTNSVLPADAQIKVRGLGIHMRPHISKKEQNNSSNEGWRLLRCRRCSGRYRGAI